MNDLDKFEPKPQEYTLQGKTFEVYPAKLRAMLAIEQYFKDLADPKSKISKDGNYSIKTAFAILEAHIPALKKGEFDVNAKQMIHLLDAIYNMGSEPTPVKKDSKKK